MAVTARAVLMAASCGSEMRRDDALMAIRPALRLSMIVLFHNSHENSGQKAKFKRQSGIFGAGPFAHRSLLPLRTILSALHRIRSTNYWIIHKFDSELAAAVRVRPALDCALSARFGRALLHSDSQRCV